MKLMIQNRKDEVQSGGNKGAESMNPLLPKVASDAERKVLKSEIKPD